MADSLGFLSKMGLKAGIATWDTAYAAVDTAIPFTNESLTHAFERMQKASLLGYGGREASEQGNQTVGGTTNHELDYNNFGPLFKAVLGTESPAGTFTVADRLALFYYLEFDKQTNRHRFGAAKATKMTIAGVKGGYVSLAMDWFCKDFDSAATAFPGITPATPTRVRFNDMVFRIGDQVDALGGGDVKTLESFEISFDRAMKTDDYVNSQFSIEPVEGDFRTVGFTLKVPRLAAETFITWKEADTALQADLVFTRGGESITIQMPELRIVGGFDSVISGAAPMTVEGNFEAYRGGTAFMYVGNEIKIVVV